VAPPRSESPWLFVPVFRRVWLYRVATDLSIVAGWQIGSRSPMVAVGIPVARHPPHRSQRALLTHWAPPSGNNPEQNYCTSREHIRHFVSASHGRAPDTAIRKFDAVIRLCVRTAAS